MPFTDDPKSEFKSTGTYYFKTGKILFESIENQIRESKFLKKNFILSLLNHAQRRPIRHFEIEHFFQWSTPED